MLSKINSILLSVAMLFCSQDTQCSQLQNIYQIGSPYIMHILLDMVVGVYSKNIMK